MCNYDTYMLTTYMYLSYSYYIMRPNYDYYIPLVCEFLYRHNVCMIT
jgi:hypothetical protein